MTTEETENKQTSSVEVCHGPKCSDFGGRDLSKELDALGIHSFAGDCRSLCPHAPVVLVDDRLITKATATKILEKLL
ncbi:MAG: (2Fe-2S) ferredoxin domain-containing protein [Mariprofundaceae bacterium]